METLSAAIGVSFLILAILTMIGIVREVLPLLAPEDQVSLRGYWVGESFRALRNRDRAIGNAWKEHVRSFPLSRKRWLFGLCLIVGIFSLISSSWFALASQ